LKSEPVKFIHVQDTGTDLILSFALDIGDDDIRSLILLRAPKFEVLLDESERGVTVSLEGEFEEAPPMLRALRMGNTSVIIETDFRSYQFDFSRVELEEIKAMEKLLVKMNFDNKFIVESA